jgi:hypothetical protein
VERNACYVPHPKDPSKPFELVGISEACTNSGEPRIIKRKSR